MKLSGVTGVKFVDCSLFTHLGGESVPDGKENLWCYKGEVLVEGVLDQRGDPHVVPMTVNQQCPLQETKPGEGKV